MLSPGNVDLYAQIDEIAIDAILKGVVFELRQRQQANFSTSVGPVTLGVALDELQVRNIRAVNPANRFGGTEASFVIKATLTLSIPGLPPIVDPFEVDINNLQVQALVTPGGLVSGIALGFANFGVQVNGLALVSAILNFILGLLSLIIRVVLAPIGLVPIFIAALADVFARLGILFTSGFPAIGPSIAGRGLVALADFQNTPPHVSNLAPVVDLVGAGSQMTVAGQMNERLANTAIQIGIQKGYFPTAQNVGGINFFLTGIGFSFDDPTPPFTGKISGWATAQGKIKKSCGFLGGLFGAKKVRIKIGMNAVADGNIAPKPAPAVGSELRFQFDATVKAKVSIPSVYGIVLIALLGPMLFLLLLLFVQVLNIVASLILPQTVQISQSGINLTVTLRHLTLGTSLFSISARAQVGATGTIDLDQIVALATARFPVNVTFPSDGLATQSLAASNGDGDLLIGARLVP